MRHCDICEKTSKMVGTRILLRGHYNPTNWSRKYPNLQKTTTPDGRKVLACTQCIRTFTKGARMEKRKAAKAVIKPAEAAKVEANPEPKKEEKPKVEKKAKRESKKPTT
jgi:hypothetical protein